MSAPPELQATHHTRRHDLDWLRVLVFGLLIFYHIGMLYVANWGFHYKSQYLSQPLEGVMLAVNQWRMPLLWVISGISIRFVLQKMTAFKFVTARSLRLLLPLLFGILVVVPPQLFVEMTGKGELDMSYWQFYQIFFDLDNPIFDQYKPGILPHIDVNHLWYLRELWTFSLITLCLSPLLNSRFVQAGVDWVAYKTGALGLYLLPIIPLVAVGMSLPDDREVTGFAFLLYGYLIGWNVHLWELIKKYRSTFLTIVISTYIAILFAYFIVWLDPALKAMWWAKWLALIAIFNAWSGVLGVTWLCCRVFEQAKSETKLFERCGASVLHPAPEYYRCNGLLVGVFPVGAGIGAPDHHRGHFLWLHCWLRNHSSREVAAAIVRFEMDSRKIDCRYDSTRFFVPVPQCFGIHIGIAACTQADHFLRQASWMVGETGFEPTTSTSRT